MNGQDTARFYEALRVSEPPLRGELRVRLNRYARELLSRAYFCLTNDAGEELSSRAPVSFVDVSPHNPQTFTLRGTFSAIRSGRFSRVSVVDAETGDQLLWGRTEPQVVKWGEPAELNYEITIG